jgi:hypothetical protein
MRYCFRCGGEIPGDQRVLREDECPHCSQDLHCCRNCRFHEPAVSNQCSEPQADYVSDKERANFCEFFAFAESTAARGPRPGEGQKAKDIWNRLFKDP